ncbi:hypothetical protein, partial [Pectobacterium versatile]|uniref:hypothetical protein n=1 Tax=Pectobacterium versatile TaxID=2488639 RepID=UPI00195FCB43
NPKPQTHFTAAEQGALRTPMQGQFFSRGFPFPYQLPVNRFPTQPVPQATVFEKAFLIYVMKRNVPFLL